MTVHFHDDLETLEVSQEVSQAAVQLLSSLWRRDRKVDPAVIARVESALAKSGVSPDELDFVRSVVAELTGKTPPPELAEDLAKVMTIVAEAENRLARLNPPEEQSPPAQGWKERFDAITALLLESQRPEERREFEQRRELIVQAVRKQPGLYLTQLYKHLRVSGSVRVTYATIWSDIHALEDDLLVMTIGGPQGSPLYCFPHPDSIPNRGAYYNRIYGTEGTIERRLTNRFKSAQMPLDFLLVNSQTRRFIMVLRYGAAGANIEGTRIKTFGKLLNFESLRTEWDVQPAKDVSPMDVLNPFNVIAFGEEGTRILWYDARAFRKFSLYFGSSSTGTTRYSSAA